MTLQARYRVWTYLAAVEQEVVALPTTQVLRVHDLANDCPCVVQAAELDVTFGQQLASWCTTAASAAAMVSPGRWRPGRPFPRRHTPTSWQRWRFHIGSRRRGRRRRWEHGSVQRCPLFAVLEANIISGYATAATTIARTVRRNTTGVVFSTFIRRVNGAVIFDFHLERRADGRRNARNKCTTDNDVRSPAHSYTQFSITDFAR